MKIAKLIVLLLLLPSLAIGQGSDLYMTAKGNSLGTDLSYPQSLRIAIVLDSENDNTIAYQRQLIKDIHNSLGNFVWMLREGGASVDTWSVAQLRKNAYQWQHFGDPGGYAVAITFATTALSFGGENKSRYVRPDSTSAQLICVGLSDQVNWNQNFSFQLGDCDTSGNGQALAKAPAQFMWYSPKDTASLDRIPYGVRTGILPTNVTQVIRYFQPIKNGAIGYCCNYGILPDTATAIQPADGDTIAKPWEIMPIAWKVKWASGKSADFFKLPAGSDFGSNMGHLLYALVARYTSIKKIKWALEFDDLTDGNPSDVPARKTAAAWDSIFGEAKQKYGIAKITTDVDPGNFSGYYKGETPGFEGPWQAGIGYGNWMERLPFIFTVHSHDSSAVRQTSNELGRYGGNTPNNGLNWSADGNAYPRYSPRWASRWDPSNAVNWQKWGIAQRLQKADSIAKAICTRCIRPPYISFPNNEVLPVNWTTRGTAPGLTSAPFTIGSSSVIVPESLWFALHSGTAGGNSSVLYLRGYVASNSGGGTSFGIMRQLGNGSIYNIYAGFDRDSFPAQSPFGSGDIRFPVSDPSGNYEIQVIGCINGGVAADPTGGRSASGQIASTFLGFRPIQQRGGSPAENVAEAWNTDPNGIRAIGPSRVGSASNRVRMVYLHPQGLLTNGDWEKAKITWLSHLRIMDDLAGRPITECVYPWELYNQ